MDRDKTDTTPPATLATTATWGVPDWRDAAAYGDTARWDSNRWRWEFYRRRADLRQCFDAYRGRFISRMNRIMPTKELWDIVTSDNLCFPLNSEDQKRFGYQSLPDPCIGDFHASLIIPTDDGRFFKSISSSTGATIGEYLAGARVDIKSVTTRGFSRNELKSLVGRFPIALAPNEVAMTFDLDKPLEPQIKAARNILSNSQRFRHSKPLQLREHRGKWLGYLRALDAREAGASWAEIAAVNPHKARTEQGARDTWKSANDLRFNL